MTDLLTQPEMWTAFLTLTLLELVLGIDNIVFISILADKLPEDQRRWARRLGLFLAMFIRIALLVALSWIIHLTQPLITIIELQLSGRDLILLAGGVFLIWKSTVEVHQLMEGEPGHASGKIPHSFGRVIFQIILIPVPFTEKLSQTVCKVLYGLECVGILPAKHKGLKENKNKYTRGYNRH